MNISGLTEKEAETSKQKYGSNVISFGEGFADALAEAFSSLFTRMMIISILIDIIWLLLGAMEITVPFTYVNGIFIKTAAVLIAAFAGAKIRSVSRKTLNSAFRQPRDRKVTVLRGNDKTEEIMSSELAVGDVIFICAGGSVPADGILLDGTLKVEQSALGLSVPAEKTPAPEGYKGSLRNLKDPYGIYGGSSVIEGSGLMKITAVGDKMLCAGKSDKEYIGIPEKDFSADIKISYAIGITAALVTAAVFTAAYLTSGNVIAGILKGLSSASVVIALVSLGRKGAACDVSAALAVKRLESSGVAVRSADVLVTAGKTDVLLTGKEGMLTNGQYDISGFIDGSGKEYHSVSEMSGAFSGYFKAAVSAAVNAGYSPDGTIYGRLSADRVIYGFANIKSSQSIPKKQAAVFADGIYGVTVTAGNDLITFVRGGFDKVFERCGQYLDPKGKICAVTNRNAVKKLAETIQLSGKDTIAFAFSDKQIKNGNIPTENFVLIGFAVMQDDYQEEAPKAVERLEKMNVRTSLVTSGSRGEAIFAVKYAGIKKSGGIIIDSAQLGKMSSAELEKRSGMINAAANISEKDRSRLVKTCRIKGENVFFAGNSADDISALDAADTAFASSSAPSDISVRCGAAAERLGISCAAELISASRRFLRDHRSFIYLKTILALVFAAAVLFLGW